MLVQGHGVGMYWPWWHNVYDSSGGTGRRCQSPSPGFVPTVHMAGRMAPHALQGDRARAGQIRTQGLAWDVLTGNARDPFVSTVRDDGSCVTGASMHGPAPVSKDMSS